MSIGKSEKAIPILYSFFFDNIQRKEVAVQFYESRGPGPEMFLSCAVPFSQSLGNFLSVRVFFTRSAGPQILSKCAGPWAMAPPTLPKTATEK